MEITLKVTKKRVIAGLTTVAVVATMVGFMSPGGGPNGGMGGGGMSQTGSTTSTLDGTIRTMTLEKRDLASSISTTGTIYSASTSEVYSNLSYPVDSILVSVGDTVKAGDTLALLDTASLESEIAQKQASLSSSQQSAAQSLKSAQQELDTYKKNLENNYDTSLLNAESSVESAEIEYESAKLDVESAERELSAARRKYNEARDGTSTSDDDDDSYVTTSGNYYSTTSSQLDELLDTVNQREISLEKAVSSMEKAKLNLDKAKASYEATLAGADDSIATYEDKVASAQISANFTEQQLALQKLQDDLASCTVKAPVDGTVTAVNAVVGGSGSGSLFVIQSEDELKIVTYIQEYDLAEVRVGSRVVITTDATGDTEFQGTLTKIAPTSTDTTTGDLTSSTDAEYEAEVTVTADANSSQLRIGMNALLSIITEESNGVYAVPYEAVDTDESGRSYVIEAVKQESGEFVAEAVYVDEGMENDLYVAISGDGLRDGMVILRSAIGIELGQTLDIAETTGMPEGMPEDFSADDLPQGMPEGGFSGGMGGGNREGMGGGGMGGPPN